jgi:hypothetical protein
VTEKPGDYNYDGKPSTPKSEAQELADTLSHFRIDELVKILEAGK